MKLGSLGLVLGIVLACAVTVPPACAQQPVTPQQPATTQDLQKQFDALREQVRVMQKDLDEIKALLAPLRAQQPPPIPADLRLDLGGRPVKGERTAKLTLVELTDYQ